MTLLAQVTLVAAVVLLFLHMVLMSGPHKVTLEIGGTLGAVFGYGMHRLTEHLKSRRR
jgi:hypothetical protein